MLRYLAKMYFCWLVCLCACTVMDNNLANGQLIDAPKDEQPVKYPYDAYTTHEYPDRIIVNFSEDLGRKCFIWEDGRIAWQDHGAGDKFFTAKLEQKQVTEMLRKIRDDYEQGAKRLGGKRFPFPVVIIHPGASSRLCLQIAGTEHLERFSWSASIVDYYEKHGIDSIDTNVDDYEQVFPFSGGRFASTAVEHYLPRDKPRTEKLSKELSKEETVMMISRFKEDISHLLFCKKLILSLLPTDQDSVETIELRMKDGGMKTALRYGTRISEYRYVYTDEAIDKNDGFLTNVPSSLRQTFPGPASIIDWLRKP